MKDLIYIGIDPSLRNFAAIAIDEELNVRERLFLSKKPLPKLRGAERLSYISIQFRSWLARFPSAIAAVEDYPYGIRGSRSVYPLGELGGVIRLALYDQGIEVTSYATQTLRKTLTGKGNASKEQVIESAAKWFGEEDNEHISFALGAALKLLNDKGGELSDSM